MSDLRNKLLPLYDHPNAQVRLKVRHVRARRPLPHFLGIKLPSSSARIIPRASAA